MKQPLPIVITVVFFMVLIIGIDLFDERHLIEYNKKMEECENNFKKMYDEADTCIAYIADVEKQCDEFDTTKGGKCYSELLVVENLNTTEKKYLPKSNFFRTPLGTPIHTDYYEQNYNGSDDSFKCKYFRPLPSMDKCKNFASYPYLSNFSFSNYKN